MPRSLLAIITNTFTETLRQPVYGVVIGLTLLVMIFSPSLAMFTLEDDNLLLKDVGLSTLLVSGLFLAVCAAATVVTREIENKTVLTVLSKTVGRSTFVLGKFIGIAGAVTLAYYFLSLTFLMVVRNGVPQTASDENDPVVILLGSVAIFLTLSISLLGNYFYRWRFSSVSVVLGTLFATFVMALLLFIDPAWSFNPAENNIDIALIGPIILTLIAVMILTAIAVTAAIRFNLLMTLLLCVFFFGLGLTLQYMLGPIAQSQSGIATYLAWVALTVVPCFNFYVVTNAIYSDISVPLAYIGQAALYAFFYVAASLMFAIGLFRSREVG